MKITFLKPAGLTFTGIAYDRLARIFGMEEERVC